MYTVRDITQFMANGRLELDNRSINAFKTSIVYSYFMLVW